MVSLDKIRTYFYSRSYGILRNMALDPPPPNPPSFQPLDLLDWHLWETKGGKTLVHLGGVQVSVPDSPGHLTSPGSASTVIVRSIILCLSYRLQAPSYPFLLPTYSNLHCRHAEMAKASLGFGGYIKQTTGCVWGIDLAHLPFCWCHVVDSLMLSWDGIPWFLFISGGPHAFPL